MYSIQGFRAWRSLFQWMTKKSLTSQRRILLPMVSQTKHLHYRWPDQTWLLSMDLYSWHDQIISLFGWVEQGLTVSRGKYRHNYNNNKPQQVEATYSEILRVASTQKQNNHKFIKWVARFQSNNYQGYLALSYNKTANHQIKELGLHSSWTRRTMRFLRF